MTNVLRYCDRKQAALIGLMMMLISLCLPMLASTTDDVTAKECDKTNCKGPIRFYEDLRCVPIYRNPGDCCPINYDCSHIAQRSDDKCYANGREYAVDEMLRDEDRVNPCDVGCFCWQQPGEAARFSCAIVDCFPKGVKPGCYWRGKLNRCCGGEEICPETADDRMKCKVDGKTYLDGERFFPNDRTDLLCQCMPGYEGQNEAPYCRNITCGVERTMGTELKQKCAPIYYYNRSPRDSCHSQFRCQNSNDTVIRSASGSDTDPNVCEFGDLKLRVGDQLSHPTSPTSSCLKCTCELPPLVTCQEISYKACEE